MEYETEGLLFQSDGHYLAVQNGHCQCRMNRQLRIWRVYRDKVPLLVGTRSNLSFDLTHLAPFFAHQPSHLNVRCYGYYDYDDNTFVKELNPDAQDERPCHAANVRSSETNGGPIRIKLRGYSINIREGLDQLLSHKRKPRHT